MTQTSNAKTKTSLDYSQIARKVIQISGDEGISKLPSGLYIVATPIGNLGDITLRALTTLAAMDHIACEDTRVTGLLLNQYGLKKPLIAYHDHNETERHQEILNLINAGHAVALVSDAGMPLIADPGYKLVHSCHADGTPVTVIPGPNAAISALAGSGLPTDCFVFHGFLPNKAKARDEMLDKLEHLRATHVFYETAPRLADSLQAIAKRVSSHHPVAVGRELTKMYEESVSGSISDIMTHYMTYPPKGEIVLMVAPLKPKAPEAYDLDSMLREAMASQSLRDAVDIIADITKLPKKQVYSRALELQQSDATTKKP